MPKMLRRAWPAALLLCAGATRGDDETAGRLVKYPLVQFEPVAEEMGRPETEPLAKRQQAHEELLQMRLEQGVVHIAPRNCDPAGPQEQCGPRDGHLPVPGGPGAPGENVNGCAWTSVGPTNINGRITSIAVDPADGQRVFVTTVGGIWRTTDGGRRWTRVSEDFLATVFASIVVSGSEVVAGGGDPNYAGGGNGIWRSTRNGDAGSWSKLPVSTFDGQTIYRLRVDPANGDIYAGASNGLWIGTHRAGALSFARLDGFDADVNDFVVDFAATPRVVYAGVKDPSPTFGKGIWKRTAPGTWLRKDTGIAAAQIDRVALALARSSPATLYAKVSRETTGRLLGVYKTTTGGEPPAGGGDAWAALPGAMIMDDSVFRDSGYSWYNSVIEVDPTDPDRVYAGGMNVYRSTDGATFALFSNSTDPDWGYGPHADQHAIAFDPANPRIVWLGNDGGIDRTTDTSAPTFRWLDVAHGMVITEFYRLTSQQARASLRAGGSQDNGTEITFGNRTWYQPGGCDGATVAVDGVNPDTVYNNCNGWLSEIVNPIPGWQRGPLTVDWTSPVRPVDPLVTDPSVAAAALAQGEAPVDSSTPPVRTGPPILLKTTDGLTWTQANLSQPFRLDQNINSIAIASSSGFRTFYVGVSGGTTAIWTTSDGGVVWNTASTGLPVGVPNRIAVDNTNPLRAFAAFGGGGGANGVWMTTNGIDWRPLSGAGSTRYPASAAAQALVIDPNDARTLYVATSVGVLRGTLSGSPATAAWRPMDEGLPDGLNVTDIWAGRDSGLLTIASLGHGAYQRDIRTDVACRTRALLVRDNVYDRGVGAAASGLPDPEHPIPDPLRPRFFKPDDTEAGRVYWWSSTDVRVDVPSMDPPANAIDRADHVEVETCPIEMGSCPAGTVWDNHPVRGRAAKAYVQVANQGIDPVRNVRVIALYADATSTLPLLPPDFWTTTFPAGGPCGPLAGGSGWRLVDPARPCQEVPVVNPAVPETVRFDWSVPMDQARHTCLFVIVESADDPLDASVRTTNERRPWVLAPGHRQIANRNLHVENVPRIPGSSGMSGMGMGWPQGSHEPPTLSVSRAGLPGDAQLGLMLPPGVTPAGLSPMPIQLGGEAYAEAKRMGLVTNVAWKISADRAEVEIPGLLSAPGQEMKMGFYWKLGEAAGGSTWRFAALARSGGSVLGGSIYYLRIAP